ncbi:MAG: hypothetical protein MJ000_11665 [Bacteroidales bacterium]|nr:hypothetical protein [Bacteroidales bacterium]
MIRDEFMFFRNASVSSPVLSGLLLWLDGQDEISESFQIRERVSGLLFTIPTNGRSGTITSNAPFIEYDTGAHCNVSILNESSIRSPKTIELTAICDAGGFGFGCWDNSISPGKKSTLGIGYSSDYVVKSSVAAAGRGAFSQKINFGQSYNIAITEDDGNCKFFIDGLLVSEFGDFTIDEYCQHLLSIVSYGSKSGSFGCLRLYSRPLSNSEILQNYNYEKSLGRVTP